MHTGWASSVSEGGEPKRTGTLYRAVSTAVNLPHRSVAGRPGPHSSSRDVRSPHFYIEMHSF
jgi:hypothetical protein